MKAADAPKLSSSLMLRQGLGSVFFLFDLPMLIGIIVDLGWRRL